MIRLEVAPNDEGKFDIRIFADDGSEQFRSIKSYDTADKAKAAAFYPFRLNKLDGEPQTVVLQVKYPNGKTHTEQIR